MPRITEIELWGEANEIGSSKNKRLKILEDAWRHLKMLEDAWRFLKMLEDALIVGIKCFLNVISNN